VKKRTITARNTRAERQPPISLYPLKFEEVVRDVLTIKPPEKERRQRSGKRQDRTRQR
jgi:hypothetical protein